MAASGAGESGVHTREDFKVEQGTEPATAFVGDKKTLEQILEAAKDGQLAMLKILLDGQSTKSRTSLDQLCPRLRDGNKRTVMHFAAATDRTDIVAYLHEICAELIDMQDADGSSPLLLASAAGSAGACRTLLERGANVHSTRTSGEQAIHLAARNGRLDVLAVLLEHGASPAAMGNHGTSLHEAAGDDEAEALTVLLRALAKQAEEGSDGRAAGGAEEAKTEDPSASSVPPAPAVAAELERPSPKGPTPLVMAAAMGGTKATAVLVRAGARLDTGAIGGLTALHLYADRGNVDGIRAILACPGAAGDAASSGGETGADGTDSLSLPAERRVQLACRRKNDDGLLPVQLALSHGHKEAAGLLLEHSAAALPEDQRSKSLEELLAAYAEHGQKDKEARSLARAQRRAEAKRKEASSWNPRDPPRHPVPGSPEGDDYADLGPLPDPATVSEDKKREAAEWKFRGDGAMKAKRFMEAVGFYGQSTKLDPTNHAVYSNKSLALLKLNQAAMALESARWCRRLAPWFVKGCYREGMARMAAMDFDRASQVFWTAYCMDNDNYEMAELFKEAVAKGKAVAARERGEEVSDSDDDEDEDGAAGGGGGEKELETAKIDE